jgi:hypothetical protein
MVWSSSIGSGSDADLWSVAGLLGGGDGGGGLDLSGATSGLSGTPNLSIPPAASTPAAAANLPVPPIPPTVTPGAPGTSDMPSIATPGSDLDPTHYADPNATIPSATPGSGKPANPADDTQPVTARIADALGKLSKASDTSHNPAPVQAGLGLHPASPQSSAFRGQNTLTNLMQLLMQRQQQYGPPGSAVAGGGRGLLGV